MNWNETSIPPPPRLVRLAGCVLHRGNFRTVNWILDDWVPVDVVQSWVCGYIHAYANLFEALHLGAVYMVGR